MGVFLDIQTLAQQAKKRGESNSPNLAGQLAEQYTIDNCPQLIKDYIGYQVHQYVSEFPNYLKRFIVNTTDSKIELHNMWCNYQKKYEYNPIHVHEGLFSFVFWVKIPFSYADEAKHETGRNSNFAQAGAFQFHYLDALGNINNHPLFPLEGDFVLFPAQLNHSVYPFYTSDGYRITISGNLSFNTSK